MPWRELSVMAQREEFVRLATMAGANMSELCRRFEISRDKGYKWLHRYRSEGVGGLVDRSRRPHRSPERKDAATEAAVLQIRAKSNGAWGGRKIARVLRDEGWADVPSPSTVTAILRRHDKLKAGTDEHPGPYQRFERPAANDLWQMDFKGHFDLASGRCHPLTLLDDHSRYALGLEACADEREATVRGRLTAIFRRHGMPFEMLMDNGSPWGDDASQPHTILTVWLLQLGIRVTHGRPYHPQTQGKLERFHRTLKAEVLSGRSYRDLDDSQAAFDRWRPVYNYERPHDALGLGTPGERYRPSTRSFPEQLPAVEYGPGDSVRKVNQDGFISFRGKHRRIGKPFRGRPVALRPTADDGVFSVHFCAHQIATVHLRDGAAPACGFVDNEALPTTPQAQQPQQKI
jgi:transposase InsO family protein